MVSNNFKTENPAKFLFLALDEAEIKEEIKNDAENKEISESDLTNRYNEVKNVLDKAQSKFSNNDKSREKFETGVLNSLKNNVNPKFPLINLANFDKDTEKGVDYGEFQDYLKYLNQRLEDLEKMPELHSNYQTPDEKRQAYEYLNLAKKSGYEKVSDLIKNGVEIDTIKARVKIYDTIKDGDKLNRLKTNLDGAWYQLDYAEETITQLKKIRGKLFDPNYKGNNSIDTDFEGWDSAGDPNYAQFGKVHLSEQEFLQRLLIFNGSEISGAEISQAFSTTPSVHKQKTTLESQIQFSKLSDEQRKALNINSPKLTGEALEHAKEKLANLKKSERLEKFLNSLEKWDGMEFEGFGEIREIRNQLRNNPEDLSTALTALNTVLKDYSDYYETNDNMWDLGFFNYIARGSAAVSTLGASEITGTGKNMTIFENFGQKGAEWIIESDTNLGIALRAVKDRQQAAEVMENEMMHLKLISAKKPEELTPEEQKFLAEHSEEVEPIKKISENAKQYEQSSEGRRIAEERYQDLLSSLRGNGQDLPPEYLQILSAGKENVVKGILSRLAFTKSTEDYIETNGTDNLSGSALLEQYNDMKGLDSSWFNWSDEHVDVGKEVAKMIVVIIATEIATAGLASFAVAAEGGALAEMAMGGGMISRNMIKVGNSAGKFIFRTAKNGKWFAKYPAKLARYGVKQVKGAAGILGKANNKLAKGISWLTRSKVSPEFIKGITTGAFRFTATEAALFGVDSPDELLAKFGQNVEMFALFIGAAGIAGKIAGRFGRVYEGGKLIESLATKANPSLGEWLAKQGIALTSEFGVFATFQAAELTLYRGEDISEFSWKDLAHMMTFSMIMRLAHAGFPKLAGKLMGEKKAMHNRISLKGEFDKVRRLAKENIKKQEKIIKNGGETVSIKDLKPGDIIEYNKPSSVPGTSDINYKMEVVKDLGNGKFEMRNFETKTELPEVNISEVKDIKRIGKNGVENVIETAKENIEVQQKIINEATTEINNINKEIGKSRKKTSKTAESRENFAKTKNIESEIKNLEEKLKKPLPENATEAQIKEFEKNIREFLKEKNPRAYETLLKLESEGYKVEFEKIESGENGSLSGKKIIIDPFKNPKVEGVAKNHVDVLTHEMGHAVTEINVKDSFLNNYEKTGKFETNLSKNEKLLKNIIEINSKTGKTLCEHTSGEAYSNKAIETRVSEKMTNAELNRTGETYRAQEDFAELHNKYQKGELESYLNSRAEELNLTKAEIKGLVESFENTFGKVKQKSISKPREKTTETKHFDKTKFEKQQKAELNELRKQRNELKNEFNELKTMEEQVEKDIMEQGETPELMENKRINTEYRKELETKWTEINQKIDANKAKSREILGSRTTRAKEYIKKRWNSFKEFFTRKKIKEKVKTPEGKKEVQKTIAKDIQKNTGLTWTNSLKVAGGLMTVWGINALGTYLDKDKKPENINIDAILDDIFAENLANNLSDNPNEQPDNSGNETPEEEIIDDTDRPEAENNGDNTEPENNNPTDTGTEKQPDKPKEYNKPPANNEPKQIPDNPKTKPAQYSAKEAGERFAKFKQPEQIESAWDALVASGGKVETKINSKTGQKYEIWTGTNGEKLMKITHSAKRRHKAKAGDEGWFLNRKGGVTKGDIRDILGRENVRRRDIKTVVKAHSEDENGIDTFTRVYRIKNREA